MNDYTPIITWCQCQSSVVMVTTDWAGAWAVIALQRSSNGKIYSTPNGRSIFNTCSHAGVVYLLPVIKYFK